MGKSGNARGYHLHFELIDLRESWDLEENVDLFVNAISHGQVKKSKFNRFCKLLFSKAAKVDPLPGIPGLMAAKKVNGKWVAVPMDDSTGQVARGK
jgi:murein DD-endopeptidase MepM/ murein hydrolase activator NlpD